MSRLSIAHVVMALAGALAFLLVVAVLRDQGATTTVLVARTNLEPGDRFDSSLTDMIELPAAIGALENLLVSTNGMDHADWRVRSRVPAGAPLRIGDVAVVDSYGSRLMSIALDSERAVAGFLAAGDLVDVVAAQGGEARFVATDIVVVDVADAGRVGRSGVVVVLAVDSNSALAIAGAVAADSVRLVRSTGVSAA